MESNILKCIGHGGKLNNDQLYYNENVKIIKTYWIDNSSGNKILGLKTPSN